MLQGSSRRRCIGGHWDGVRPTCVGLSQHFNYSSEKPPTILFRHMNGQIAQVWISSTFYVQIFHANVVFLVTFWLCQKIHTKNSYVKQWWNWRQVSISSTFYTCVFVQKCFTPHFGRKSTYARKHVWKTCG